MERERKDGIESKAQKARKASVSPVAATGGRGAEATKGKKKRHRNGIFSKAGDSKGI